MNTYVYAQSNPIIFKDILGLFVTGEWLEKPHVIDIDAGIPQFKGYDFGAPSILPPGVRAYFLYVNVKGYVKYKLKCKEYPEQNNQCLLKEGDEWIITEKKKVNTTIPIPVRLEIGPGILKGAKAAKEAVNVAKIQFDQIAAVIASSPDLICILGLGAF